MARKENHGSFKNDRIFHFLIIVLLLVGFVGHLLYITAPSVNLEWVFAEAAKELAAFGHHGNLGVYWNYEANPLGYSIMVAVLAKLFHLPITQTFARIPALLGYLLIMFSSFLLYQRQRLISGRQLFWWSALVTFSPLIWVYSGSSTADIFPIGLLMLSLVVCYLAQKRTLYLVCSSLLYGLSLIIKFHGGLFIFFFIYIIFISSDKQNPLSFLKSLFIFALPGLLIVGSYFIYLYQQYHIFVISSTFGHIYTPSLDSFAVNFVNYVSYLELLLGPMALIPLIGLMQAHGWKNRLLLLAPIFLLSSLSVWAFSFHHGEMNYGGLDYIFSKHIFHLFNFFGAFLFFSLIFHAIFADKSNRRFAISILLVVLPFLVLSSLVRPSQRYLMFLLPLLFLYIVACTKVPEKIVKFLVGVTVALFIVALIPELSYRLSEAKASYAVAHWLIRHSLIKHTDTAALSGNYYFAYRKEPKKWGVKVRRFPLSSYVYQYPVTILGQKIKAYYVVRLRPA